MTIKIKYGTETKTFFSHDIRNDEHYVMDTVGGNLVIKVLGPWTEFGTPSTVVFVTSPPFTAEKIDE